VSKEAESAIRTIGSDAISHLLGMIETPEPFWKVKLRERLPKRWHRGLRLKDTSYEQRRAGSFGLAALGERAAPAVPELIRIAKEHLDDDSRYMAVFTMRTLGHAAEPAIPFLIQCMTNETWMVRHDATIGLGYLQLRPDLVVPALVEHLRRTDVAANLGEEDVCDTIQSLGWHETNAVTVFGLVSGYLDSDSQRIRDAATNALWRIDQKRSTEMNVIPAWWKPSE
jgi:HEAT repeat protein